MNEKRRRIIEALGFSDTAEQVNHVLTVVGKYESWEAKRAYLEALCNLETIGPHQGDDEDSFWSTAEAFLMSGFVP